MVKLAGQQNVDSLCESAASLLTLGEGEQRSSGEDTSTGETAQPTPVAAAAAVKAAEPPPMMLSDADMMMVCRPN